MPNQLYKLILVFLVTGNMDCFSQKTLEICFTRFGKLKKFEIYNGDVLEYKLHGQYYYHKNKIVNLQDSFIVFSNDSVIKLNQLKKICIRNSNFFMRLSQKALITLGNWWVFLDVANNLINNRNPVIDQNAALVGGSLIATGILVKQINIKRLKINEHKHLKILDHSFNNLAESTEK